MKKVIICFLYSLLLITLVACFENKEVSSVDTKPELLDEMVTEEMPDEPLKTYDVIYTLDEVLSLTFDRIISLEKISPLLDQLDRFNIKASIFASTEQIEKYPESVEAIIKRGHQIESNAFNKKKIKSLHKDELYELMKTNQERIKESTSIAPSYLAVASSKTHDKVNKIATQLGFSGLVHHSYQLRGLKTDDEDVLMNYMRRAVARGGILSMDPEDSHAIPYLMKEVDAVDFTLIPLADLIELDQGRLTFEEIEGADAIQINPDISEAEPFIHTKQMTDKKEVALTFDDWASERVVLDVLKVLDDYNIKATFYLKTKIIPENPNLARLLIEKGHEVASHSHSHENSTTLSTEQLQKDLYKAHKIITEAIQEQPKLYFRPPFGKVNDEAASAITAMGYEAITDYDVSSYDWNDEFTEEDVINRVMSRVQPGSVIVMHILNDIHTPSVLPGVIEALQDAGYEFVLTSDWLDKQ